MKKTVKLILVVTVIAILSLMATSAYAYEIGDSVMWQLLNESDEYSYFWYDCAGEFAEGENKTVASDDYVVYEFKVKESGYYFVLSELWVGFGEKYEDGIVKEYADSMQMVDENGNIGNVFYLEKGTTFARVWSKEANEVNIEYYGSLEDVILTDGKDEEIRILDEDVFYNGYGTLGLTCFDFDVKFSGGKTLSNFYECTCCCNFYGETVNEFKAGKNDIIFTFFNHNEVITIDVHEITEYIQSVELSNIEKYTTVYEDYKGETSTAFVNEEVLTVNYTDGTSCEVEIGFRNSEVPLPCGRKVDVYTNYSDDRVFEVIMAQKHYIEIDCKVERLTFRENLNILNADNMTAFYKAKNNFEIAIDDFLNNSENFTNRLRYTSVFLGHILRYVEIFVTYYLTIAV